MVWRRALKCVFPIPEENYLSCLTNCRTCALIVYLMSDSLRLSRRVYNVNRNFENGFADWKVMSLRVMNMMSLKTASAIHAKRRWTYYLRCHERCYWRSNISIWLGSVNGLSSLRYYLDKYPRTLSEGASANDNWSQRCCHFKGTVRILRTHERSFIEWKIHRSVTGLSHRKLECVEVGTIRAYSVKHWSANSHYTKNTLFPAWPSSPLQSPYVEPHKEAYTLDLCLNERNA